MPTFLWEGKTKTGDIRKGSMEAASEEMVLALLKKQEIQASSIKRKAGFKFDASNLPLLGGSVGTKDLVVFTRQFATMINAGLPLVQCLDILGTQSDNAALKRVLLQVKSDVEGGSTFADALKKHPKVFDDLFCNLVAAGEVGGILDTIMNRLAGYIEKNQKLVKKVKSAMTYPIAVLVVAILVVIGLLWKVIPTFEKMFRDFGGELPALTRIVIDMSNGFQNNLFLIMGSIVAFAVGSITFAKSNVGKEIIDRVLIQAPVFGPLIRKVAVAKFTRTMSTMIASGVPILDGLTVVSRTAGNRVVERAIVYTREKISEGKNIAEPMMETKVFPPMVVQMIAVGEATGAMDTMMSKIADFYEEEVDSAVEALTALIEPFIMVFLAVIAGGMVIAMYLPIFSIAGSIK
ncbi:MAG: type II secretion system F family protein [Deltaproteobacteria bacterium]|nr:type II secretion system F family protein [Deltaproteobacteria bacterium]